MSFSSDAILSNLQRVSNERERRASTEDLGRKIASLKSFQQRRFSHTYADLLPSPRYGGAAHFFLDEVYGPDDFTRRDAQFARVVPALVRLFPRDVVETVGTLAELHALSEELDTAMALQLMKDDVSPLDYIRAWQATGRPQQRQMQIDLTLSVAVRLDDFTRKPLLRNSLRLMRGPARAAGLSELQQFLEAGFDTFRAMKGAQEFMSMVKHREQGFASSLFAARLDDGADNESMAAALAALPGQDK